MSLCGVNFDRSYISVKWLGKDAVNPLVADGKFSKAELAQKVQQWSAAGGRNVAQPGMSLNLGTSPFVLKLIVRTVLIVSYETLRTLEASLAGCEIGLLLCDEGHRLKNSGSDTFKALNKLRVKRRVILSGTPIQVHRTFLRLYSSC